MRCITGAKFTMTATLLHINDNYSEPVDPGNPDGSWVQSQDPLTGEIVNKWEPGTHSDVLDTVVDETVVGDFECVARGMSINSRYGSGEDFGKDYKNIDMVRLWVPVHVRIKKSDRVYNIRNGNTTLWLDDDGKPVTFNVNGVTPQFNGPFNQHNETFALLERVEF
jgi:hypothetical protein